MIIDKDNVEDIISLSPVQEGVLFQYLKNPAVNSYFERISLDIKTNCNVAAFRDAVAKTAAAHENLRCMFRWKALSQPVAIYLREFVPGIVYEDLSVLSDSPQLLMEKMLDEDYQQGFDLEQVPCRFLLCKLADRHFRLTFCYHHMLFDGWSNGIILKDLFRYWMPELSVQGTTVNRRGSFKDYIHHTLKLDHSSSLQFWRDYMSGAGSLTRLPYRLAKGNTPFSPAKASVVPDREKVEAYCASLHITIANFMYGIWGYLLQTYNHSDAAVFGTPVSGRLQALSEFEYTSGLFINTVPLCVKVTAGVTIAEFLQDLGKKLLERATHEMTPLRDIRKSMDGESGEELFETIMVIENYPVDEFLKEYGDVIDMSAISAVSANHYDLTVEVSLINELRIDFVYNEHKISRSGVDSLMGHFTNTLHYFMEHPDRCVDSVEILSEQEKDIIYHQFNNTAVAFPVERTVIDFFEEQVKFHPERIAVTGELPVLTYRELSERAYGVAAELRRRGIGKGSVIAIWAVHSIDFVVGVYGILKAGAAYMPVDPGFPRKRIEYMLSDSQAALLLADKALRVLSEEMCSEVLYLQHCGSTTSTEWENPVNTDTAYIIYTSGSTGNPKGVLITHGALTNRLHWMQKAYPLTDGSVILNKTSLCFDVSVWELFWWAVAGARVCILPEGMQKDPLAIIDWVNRFGVTVMHFVPSMFNVFLDVVSAYKYVEKLDSLDVLFSSGEALSGETVNKFNRLFSRKRPRLINLYGPTEATIDVSFYECDRVNYDAPVPIGKPIDNICLYVMSRLMQLQPVGVAGELCIAGVGLAKGYVNNPGLTDKKFITWRGQRLYRTGDLAKYDTDGNIIFLGRMDDQVKIRGFRIELSEIEQCLMKHPRVENAVVLQKHTNGDSYLCAFYSSAAMLDEAELNAWLSDFLPEYCIPSVYSYRPVFTFNANGKLDRNALIQEAPHRRADKKTDNGVLSKKELLVLGICQSVLGTGSLSIHSSFISLGGDSIKAIQLQARLAREEYFVGVADILSAPSLKSLCSVIILMEQQRLATEPATGDILLTSVQQQFFSTAFTNPDFFLQGITLVSGQRFDKQLVADAFHHLQAHHDALRTIFRMETDTVTAFIPVEVTPVTPVYIEITENDTAATLLDITGRLRREISISKKQLFRMAVVNTKNAGYLVMVAHHLIVDILSWRILAEDFVHLYDQLKAGKHPQPGRKTSSVKKWGEALHGFSRRKDVLETMKHWMRGSGGEPPASPAAPVKWGAYKRTGVKISRETTKILLSELCPGYKVSMPDIILYILTKSYQVLTDQQYLCVAMEGHGRERIIPDIELNRTVGWFTAIYPVRFEVPAAELSVQGLMNVRDRMQQVPHKGLSYGALRYLSEDPLIRQQLSGNQSDILFNYMSEPDAVGIHNSQVSYYLHSDEQVMHTDNVVGFNIIVSAIIRQHQLELNFDYDSTKYAEQDMNRLTRKMEEFTAQLVSICYHSEIDAGMLADFSDGDLTIAELDKIRQMIR